MINKIDPVNNMDAKQQIGRVIDLPEITVKPVVFTENILREVCPQSPKNATVFIGYLNRFMPRYGIDTIGRAAAFIAQVAQESGQFRYVRELASGAAYDTGKRR